MKQVISHFQMSGRECHRLPPLCNEKSSDDRSSGWKAGVLLIALSLFSFTSHAQWTASTDRNQVAIGESLQLTLRASDRHQQLNKQPDLSPLQDKFNILNTQKSSQYQSINGKSSAWTEWVIDLTPKNTGNIQIPSIALAGDYTKPIRVKVNSQSAKTKSVSDEPIFIQSSVSNIAPYVQQEIILTLQILRSTSLVGEQTLQPLQVENAITNQLGEIKQYSRLINGKRYGVFEIRYAIYPQKSGPLTIPPVIFESSIPYSSPQSNFFSITRTRPVRAISESIDLNVRDIPNDYPKDKPWLPARSLTISQNWQGGKLNQLKAGDSITRAVKVTAKGLSASQIPHVQMKGPAQLKIYPDQPELKENTGKNGQVSSIKQAFALVPTESGQLKLPAIHYTWYNTEKESVEQTVLPAKILQIQPSDQENNKADTPSDSTNIVQEKIKKPAQKDIIPVNGFHPWVWQLASALLLLLLILGSIIIFLLTRQIRYLQRKNNAPDSGENTQTALSSERENLEKLMAVSREQNLAKIRSALLCWLQSCSALPFFPTLDDYVKKTAHHELRQLIYQLEEQLYSKKPDEQFNIERLQEKLKSLSRAFGIKPDTRKHSGLPDKLNPA